MIDFNIDKGKPFKNSDIELILQQIDLLFDTSPKDVLGDEEYGSQYDRFLYDLNISNEGLRNKVLSDINSINLFGFTPEVNVYLLQGVERDIALIEIILTKETEQYKKTYKIS